jgi:hypothetical protein
VKESVNTLKKQIADKNDEIAVLEAGKEEK